MPAPPDLYNATIAELQRGLTDRQFTSVQLVQAYLKRISEVNDKLHVVLQTSPAALQEAARCDKEREVGSSTGLLHGIPILLKDTINTAADLGMDTTSGSHAMIGARPKEDAYAVWKLRKAGAIILGKCNLGAWNNARSMGGVPNGWSPIGGITKSAFYKDSSPSGSSSGNAVATTIGLCAASVGGETNASLLYPALLCNVVGLRPTIGLISRSGVSPISSTFDTLGPVARTVEDVAVLLDAMVGPDMRDSATLKQPPKPDYLKCTKRTDLRGIRLGYPRRQFKAFWQYEEGIFAEVTTSMDRALDQMRELGAQIVDVEFDDREALLDRSRLHAIAEMDAPDDMARYLADFEINPNAVKSISDIVKFGREHPDLEFPHGLDSQDWFERTLKHGPKATQPTYEFLKTSDAKEARKGIDTCFLKYGITAVVYPCLLSTAFVRAGYPQIVVPLGFLSDEIEPTLQTHPTYDFTIDELKSFEQHPNQPFGLSFSGLAHTESKLLAYAHAFEQATQVRSHKQAIPEYMPITQLRDML